MADVTESERSLLAQVLKSVCFREVRRRGLARDDDADVEMEEQMERAAKSALRDVIKRIDSEEIQYASAWKPGKKEDKPKAKGVKKDDNPKAKASGVKKEDKPKAKGVKKDDK